MISQTDRSLQAIQDDVLEIKETLKFVKRSHLVLVRVTFILLITALAQLIWG